MTEDIFPKALTEIATHMDAALQDHDVEMTLSVPEGSVKVETIVDNINMGPLMRMLVLMNAMIPIGLDLAKKMEMEPTSSAWHLFLDTMFNRVKDEIAYASKEGETTT